MYYRVTIIEVCNINISDFHINTVDTSGYNEENTKFLQNNNNKKNKLHEILREFHAVSSFALFPSFEGSSVCICFICNAIKVTISPGMEVYNSL